MNQPRLFLTTFLAVCFLFASVVAASAQSDDRNTVQPNFEVSLHLIVGSTDAAAKGELPASLAAISRQIRSSVPYSSYRVVNTYLGRVGNTGNFEYKSLGDLGGKSVDAEPATFLEWSVANLRAVGNEYQANSFRFGARVPVKTSMPAEGGRSSIVFNYEAIGLSLARLGVSENVPTLLGTLSLPQTSGTLFLVMTVKKTDK